MPLWYTEPINIQSPLEIDGLIGWYNSNSAQFSENNFLIRWNDLSYFKNHLVPYNNYSNITSNFNFNNAVLTNEALLNLDTISSGATIFIVGDLSNNTIDTSYFVSFFTNTFENNDQIDDLRISTRYDDGLSFLEVGNSFNNNAIGYINNTTQTKLINAVCFNKLYNNVNGLMYYSAGYINNLNIVQSFEPSNITINMNNFNVFIGDYSNMQRTGHGINNKIFEVLLYNKVLLQNDITFINRYLANKHNINLNNNFIY